MEDSGLKSMDGALAVVVVLILILLCIPLLASLIGKDLSKFQGLADLRDWLYPMLVVGLLAEAAVSGVSPANSKYGLAAGLVGGLAMGWRTAQTTE
jgi:hypothetical protein